MKTLIIIAVIIAMFHLVLLFLSMFLNHIFYEKIILFEKTWCHQITSRSFSFAGLQMPLCARCCGIMIGLSLVFFIKTKMPKNKYFNLVICIIGLIDIMLKPFGINSPNLWRLFAGISFSLLFVIFVGFIANSIRSNASHIPNLLSKDIKSNSQTSPTKNLIILRKSKQLFQ